MLISLIMVIISQCMLYPNIKFYALSIDHVFLVSYCSVNLKKKNSQVKQTRPISEKQVFLKTSFMCQKHVII